MFKKQISLFVATFLIIGFFFLALPEKGYSGAGPLGCCLANITGDCIGCGEGECAIRRDACPLDASFLQGACSGTNFCVNTLPTTSGCCVILEGNCIDGANFAECDTTLNSVAWFLEADCSEVPECVTKVKVPIPTLTQWGLIATAGVLGIVGFMVIRRRKVTA